MNYVKEMYMSLGEDLRDDIHRVDSLYFSIGDSTVNYDCSFGKCSHEYTDAEKEAFRKAKRYQKCKNKGVSTDGIYDDGLEDFAHISNDKMREDLVKFQEYFIKSRNLFIKGDVFEYKDWGRFVWFTGHLLNIWGKEYTKYYEFKTDKFFLYWYDRSDFILEADDLYCRFKHKSILAGNICKYSSTMNYALEMHNKNSTDPIKRSEFHEGISIEDQVKRTVKYFYFIVCVGQKEGFDMFVYHVFWFLWKSINTKEFSISPKRVYGFCKLQYFEKHQRPYIKRSKNSNHQRYYYKEGFNENDLKKYMRKQRMDYIVLAIEKCKNDGQLITLQNIQVNYMKTGGYVRLAKGDNKTRGTISINTVISLVEEMKTMSEYKDIVSTIVSKSDWKQMIDLNVKSRDNYNEIIKVYPDVKYGTYRNERSKKKLS